MILKGGTFGNVNLGNQDDRAFVYDGTYNGEFQNGAGTDYIFLFGGTIANTEMQRTSVNSVTVIDGATVNEIETQGPNASSPNGGVNSTFYLRSGFVGAGQWGSANTSNFVIDPINSVDANSVDPTTIDAKATELSGGPLSGVAAMQYMFLHGFALNTNAKSPSHNW